MQTTLVQLTEELLAALDERGAATGRSRSDLVREAVQRYLEEDIASEVDRRIVEGYRRHPQEPDPWIERLARESIAEEHW